MASCTKAESKVSCKVQFVFNYMDAHLQGMQTPVQTSPVLLALVCHHSKLPVVSVCVDAGHVASPPLKSPVYLHGGEQRVGTAVRFLLHYRVHALTLTWYHKYYIHIAVPFGYRPTKTQKGIYFIVRPTFPLVNVPNTVHKLDQFLCWVLPDRRMHYRLVMSTKIGNGTTFHVKFYYLDSPVAAHYILWLLWRTKLLCVFSIDKFCRSVFLAGRRHLPVLPPFLLQLPFLVFG